MNPVVIIPTYWSGRRSSTTNDLTATYDASTPVSSEGLLPRCLDSLRKVQGLGRVILLVAAEPGVENQAAERVHSIAKSFPDIETAVVAQPELAHINRKLEQIGAEALADSVSLTGYGSIHNLGLICTSIFGHDIAVFVDEDEVIDDPAFLEKAVYGMGSKTPSGSVISAKTGFFLNEHGDYTAPENVKWYERMWNSNHDFNEYITSAVNGPRLSRANNACSGCMSLHADTFGRVAFDPWIARGVDLDYVINARMYGVDIWFDNQWYVHRLPEKGSDAPVRFERDVYRWFYENRKVEFAQTQIDLLQVTAQSLMPYPGPWLTRKINQRARFTAYLSALMHSDHKGYWRAGNGARKEAAEYAREHCSRYFELQRAWPELVRAFWQDTPLATQLSGARQVRSAAPAFTGRFSAVTGVSPEPRNEAPAPENEA